MKTATRKKPSRKREELAKLADPKKPGSIEEAENLIRGIRDGLKVCDDEIKALRKDGASEDARKWLMLRTQIAARYTVAHRDLLKLRQQHKELVAVADAMTTFTTFLSRIRQQLDNMPASLCSKCNPSDPDHARDILTEWRDRLLVQLSQAEAKPLP